VERLAELSRLSLGPQEAERLRGELSSILEYFAALDKVDVSKASPAQNAPSGSLRENAARPPLPTRYCRASPKGREGTSGRQGCSEA